MGRGGGPSRRRAVRRAVQLSCQVLSDLWDEPIELPLSDLSHEGAWLETPLPLDQGEELLVSFSPPRGTWRGPLLALARVARVGMWRRAYDRYPVGMGLAFVDLADAERRQLARCLRGIPPRLPRQARARAADGGARPLFGRDQLPEELTFTPLGALVTTPRPVEAA